MVILLLSLLNDFDLANIADFLETTYRIKAERGHLELLFPKVIPLMSINSKVFLKAMVRTCDGYDLLKDRSETQSEYWDIFVQRLLVSDFLLPGGIEDLGRATYSWIVKWPEDGFKSIQVFNSLQYHGARMRAINDIPPIELHPEGNLMS